MSLRISSGRAGPPIRVNTTTLDSGDIVEFGPGDSVHGATTGPAHLVISSAAVAPDGRVPSPLPPSVRIVDACESYAPRRDSGA